MNLSINDEITMKLVHYFITKENYQPIVVAGLENEIWLENTDKPYRVIRINGNYIHNNEQLEYDIFKSKAVIKEIKKKTLSLNIDALSILLDVGDNVNIEKAEDKHITTCSISSIKDLRNNKTINEIFPDMKDDKLDTKDPLNFFINVTKDINESTNKKSKLYEKVFSKKLPIVTYILIALNVLIYLLNVSGIIGNGLFYMNGTLFKMGEYWRVLTYAFFHDTSMPYGILHILCNMYSLYIIGSQVEQVYGKVKYITIYLISAITAGLLSGVLNTVGSIGASGAIFGLCGAILYFGYHYRLYLGNQLKTQLIPILIINLFIGFMPGIDGFGHLGGLVGGIFASLIVGVEGYTTTKDRANGIIVTTILVGFLIYMLLFR